MDLGQDLDLRPLAARRLADRDAALRHDQRAEQAAEVVHAGLHHHAELVARLRAVRVFRGQLEEEIEVVVARAQVARQDVDARARLELALQAFERGLHEILHERVRAILAVAGEERRDRNHVALVTAQAEDVGRRALVVLAEAVDAAGGRGRDLGERGRNERRGVRAVIARRHPERRALGVIEADPERPRHQHPQKLAVGVEIRLRTGKVRRQFHGNV